MTKKLKLTSDLHQYALNSQKYYQKLVDVNEIDELYYYFDDVLGDGRGLE